MIPIMIIINIIILINAVSTYIRAFGHSFDFRLENAITLLRQLRFQRYSGNLNLKRRRVILEGFQPDLTNLHFSKNKFTAQYSFI